MKSSLLKTITVVVGLALASTTIIAAFTFAGEPDVYSYIPSDSNVVAHLNLGNSTYYVFAENASYGVITETPVWQISSAIKSTNINGTSNVTVNTIETYRGFTIFEFTGISYVELMSFVGVSVPMSNITVPLTELSLYATELTKQYSVVGSLSGILNSINASVNNNGFKNLKTYINESIPLSLTVFLGDNGIISTVSLNVTMNNTALTMGSVNPLAIPYILKYTKSFSSKVNVTLNSITLNIGVGWADLQFLIGELTAILGQTGGINAQNLTGISLLF